MDILPILLSLLVTAISLIIISKIPIGVEIDSFQKALLSAVVFGLLNAFLRPAIGFIFAIPNFLTFGLFSWVVNVIIFGVAAWLVQGFRLRYNIISAALGAFFLTLVNSIIYKLLNVIT